eukprot:1162016-Pelagomonas_calceolata.AAC.6
MKTSHEQASWNRNAHESSAKLSTAPYFPENHATHGCAPCPIGHAQYQTHACAPRQTTAPAASQLPGAAAASPGLPPPARPQLF